MAAPQLPFQFASAADAVHPALSDFHPLVQRWFRSSLGAPSEPQSRGWPRILAGEDVLIAAPTGSGKTLSAFLAALDRLLRLALENRLEDRTRVVYVSPLKALGNDVQKNLLGPLEAIYELAAREGLSPEPIRVQVRTGDTPASERAQMVPPPASHPHHHARVALPGTSPRPEVARRSGTWRRSSWTRFTRSPGTSAAAIWRSRSSGSRRRFAVVRS